MNLIHLTGKTDRMWGNKTWFTHQTFTKYQLCTRSWDYTEKYKKSQTMGKDKGRHTTNQSNRMSAMKKLSMG